MKPKSVTTMKKPRNYSVLIPLSLLSLFIVLACSNEPQPINYGHDACSFCEMTIVSQNFSAQAVSTKGKQFKYDSVECLVHHLGQEETKMERVWVADYQHPGTMIEASKAHFIINDSLNSPMGAYLAAVRHERSNTFLLEKLQEKLLQESSVPGSQLENISHSEVKSHH